MAADGTIKIYTDVDTKGVTSGTKNIEGSISKISKRITKIGKSISGGFSKEAKKTGKTVEKNVSETSEKILNILNDSERSAKSKAASIAAIYRKEGLSQEEAFKKAWQHIERDSANGSEKVKKHLFGIGKKSKSVGNEMRTNLSSGITGAIKKIGGLIATAFAVQKVVQFGKECLELGSDLQEVQNVVDVTFPSMTAHVDKFAKSAANSFGLSETMAKRYTGTFGAMAKAFGFTEQAAYDMGTTLTGLAGDVASFYNISQDEAYTKLKSVFTGETETLKDLG